MAYFISLKQFEGPLDLLLTLITKAKVDICDIFVSEITEQYLQSMEGISELDMDTASEFLTMAATLIEIKSRALLPRMPEPEEEGAETPEQALIRRLQEYKAYKEGAGQMREFEKAAQAVFSKLPEEYPLPPPTIELTGLSIEGLMAAIERMIKRLEEKAENTNPVVREIARDNYSIEDCVTRITVHLKKGPVRFTQLLSAQTSRNEIVTMFMALLELLKLGRMHVEQDHAFDDILLIPGRRAT